ncbi:MAG: LCP family protein [Clostridia bacterium]|nr:LCP family protein [Clostridia bacterium]
MKRLLSLLLVLALALPFAAFAENDEELDIEVIVEDVDLDETDSVPADAAPLPPELQAELASSLESKDYVPTALDNNNLYINPNLPGNVINILLLGVDTRNAELIENDVKLADVQMILSYNYDTGAIKLSSILRDTLVVNPNTGKNRPINESYQSYDAKNIFHDNPQRSVATVNYNFEMNIQYYVTINFHGVAAIIDTIGGVDVDLTKGEAWNINYYIKKNGSRIGRTYGTGQSHPALEVKDGVQHLDGIQALMYARLRKSLSPKYDMGGDWQRTVRTRHLMDLLLQKVLKMGAMDLLDLVGTAVEYINSNMNVNTMADLVLQVLRSGITEKLGKSDSLIEQFRIPMGDAETGDKTWSYDPDSGKIFMSRNNGNFQKNIEGLHEFIYGKYYPANP